MTPQRSIAIPERVRLPDFVAVSGAGKIKGMKEMADEKKDIEVQDLEVQDIPVEDDEELTPEEANRVLGGVKLPDPATVTGDGANSVLFPRANFTVTKRFASV